jgi:recombination protein RecA
MANTNKAKIMELCKKINKKEGEGAVYSLGKDNGLKMKRWSTGIEDLDNIIGGGMPEGRIIEIFGPESSGKTSLGYHLASLHDMALDIPIEGTFDAERAKVFGNKPKQMLVYRARYGEQAMNQALQFAEAGIPLIIIDSIPACKPREDIEKLKKQATTGLENNERIGGVARVMHRYLPVLEEICENTGTTVILINQVRDKMDAMLFGDKTDTPGGRAPKFYSSIRIQVARRAWIEIPNKDPANSAANKKIGIIMKCKVVKSKVSNPMGECEIPMLFDRGFVSFDDMQTIRKEMMKKNRVKSMEDEEEE